MCKFSNQDTNSTAAEVYALTCYGEWGALRPIKTTHNKGRGTPAFQRTNWPETLSFSKGSFLKEMFQITIGNSEAAVVGWRTIVPISFTSIQTSIY